MEIYGDARCNHFFGLDFWTSIFLGGGQKLWETGKLHKEMVSNFSAPRSHRSGGNVKAVAVATPNGELVMGDEVVSVNGL